MFLTLPGRKVERQPERQAGQQERRRRPSWWLVMSFESKWGYLSAWTSSIGEWWGKRNMFSADRLRVYIHFPCIFPLLTFLNWCRAMFIIQGMTVCSFLGALHLCLHILLRFHVLTSGSNHRSMFTRSIRPRLSVLSLAPLPKAWLPGGAAVQSGLNTEHGPIVIRNSQSTPDSKPRWPTGAGRDAHDAEQKSVW